MKRILPPGHEFKDRLTHFMAFLAGIAVGILIASFLFKC